MRYDRQKEKLGKGAIVIMENMKLAVIAKDKEYGRALSLALIGVYQTFTVTLYQSVPVHTKLDQFDLVLKDYEEDDTGDFIYLVEKPSMVVKDYENRHFRLYKYGNVRQLTGELLFIYTSITGRKVIPVKKQEMKMVVFCSAEGGAGCTSAAMAFAQEMKRFHGRNVIYVSLEELESTPEYMEVLPGGKSISEYLYYLFREDSHDRIPFIESFLVSDLCGVDAFLPSPGRNVLKDLSIEEMQQFAGAVMDTGQYDIVVFDIGCSLDQNALCCCEMSNHICLVTKEQGSWKKEERLMEYLTFSKGEKMIERMGKVVNCCKQKSSNGQTEAEEEMRDEILPIICRLQEEPESFKTQNHLRAISLDGAYGKGIKRLADSVLRNTLLQ